MHYLFYTFFFISILNGLIWICLKIQGTAFRIQDDMIVGNEDKKEFLQEIINNAKLSEGYITLARDLEIMEPKSPEDIYKV